MCIASKYIILSHQFNHQISETSKLSGDNNNTITFCLHMSQYYRGKLEKGLLGPNVGLYSFSICIISILDILSKLERHQNEIINSPETFLAQKWVYMTVPQPKLILVVWSVNAVCAVGFLDLTGIFQSKQFYGFVITNLYPGLMQVYCTDLCTFLFAYRQNATAHTPTQTEHEIGCLDFGLASWSQYVQTVKI